MGKRRSPWILSIALIAVAFAVFFEPTHCVRGWLWGEAFFDGRPTSYWRSVVEADFNEPDFSDDKGKPTLWLSFCEKCGLETRRQQSNILIGRTGSGAVLAELTQDRSPRVRVFAERVIAYNTMLAEATPHDRVMEGLIWRYFLAKARAVPDRE